MAGTSNGDDSHSYVRHVRPKTQIPKLANDGGGTVESEKCQTHWDNVPSK